MPTPRNHAAVDEDSDDTDWDSIYEEQEEDDDVNDLEEASSSSSNNNNTSSKRREAESERRTMGMPPPPPPPQRQQQQQSSSPPETRQMGSSTWLLAPNESTPLFDAGPPPPAYSDVAAQRPYPGSAQVPVRAGDSNQGEEAASFEDRGKKRRHPGWCMRLSKLAVLLLVITMITLFLATTFRHSRSEDNGGDLGDGDPGNNNPGHNDGDGDNDNDEMPPPGVPTDGTWWPDRDLEDCDLQHFTNTHRYGFSDPRSFSFVELMEDMYDLNPNAMNGNIKVTAAPPDQKDPIELRIWFATTPHYEITRINGQQSNDGLSLASPSVKLTGKSVGSKSCIALHVTIFLQPGVELSDFELATHYCSIRADPSLFTGDEPKITIRDTTDISTISGSVDFAHWDSRSTIIDVISGDVSGTYALNDLLSIKTRSGSIDVVILPQKIDPEHPSPAKFTADTISGNVFARFPTTGSDLQVPKRDYQTSVKTRSGTIRGAYMLGSKTSFKSVSGTIDLNVLPYSSASASSDDSIRTETISGTTRVVVLSPFHNDGSAIGSLNGWHKTISASVGLLYPPEWEGSIAATSISGGLLVAGQGVEVVERSDRPGRQLLLAKKGEGKSKTEISTASGRVEVIVGEVDE